MTYWTICFPGEFGQNVTETWSESQIILSYWDYWRQRMVHAGKNPELITCANCIDDWVVLHWAVKTDEHGKIFE